MPKVSGCPESVTVRNPERNLMMSRSISVVAAISLCATLLGSCGLKPEPGALAAPTPFLSPTPTAKPLVAYLNEGNLWTIRSDGMNQRIIAMAPDGEAIQDFVWSLDGTRIFFS